MTLPLWTRVLVALAALKIGTALGGVLAETLSGEQSAARPFPTWVFVLQITAFAATGVRLIWGSRGERRALYLGGAMLVAATSYCLRPIEFLEQFYGHPLPLRLIGRLQLDALLPALLWSFVREFPEAIDPFAIRRLGRIFVRISLALGAAAIVVNLALVSDAAPNAIAIFDARSNGSPYWAFTYGLLIPVFPFALVRARNARTEERRRIVLFLTGTMVAAVPVGLFIICFAIVPGFASWVRSPSVHAIVMPIIQLLLLSVPISTAYSVLVARVLDVRVIVRAALQYGLARALVAAATVTPFLWIAAQLYDMRDVTLAALARSPRSLALGGAFAAGATLINLRGRAIEAIDRLFFREHYDSRQILLELAESSRSAATPADLAHLLTTEIDRALHLDSVAVLIADASRSRLEEPKATIRPLEATTELALLMADPTCPAILDWESSRLRLAALPESDRQWLVDADIEMLVPLRSSAGELVGAIALGPKRSELEFSRDDRHLMTVLASAVATALENRILRAGAGSGDSVWPKDEASSATTAATARECLHCGVVHPSDADTCDRCRRSTAPVGIPHCVLGKFRLEARIGAGSMGVVYRATDIALQRTVAIKTLPRTSPEDSMRMRREARAMASISHPNLALIYGAETWRGIPVLILELLEGGTLADRIASRPLSPREAMRLGASIADVLACTHGAGILHRDIKPSNIAFTRDGTPKLLDFGLARIALEGSRPGSPYPPDSRDGTSLPHTQGTAGTPLYMSPEALGNRPADSSFDLWSLAVVLFESIAGQHPFEYPRWSDTFDAIRNARSIDLRDLVPTCPDSIAALLADCMSPQLRRRPSTAREMRERLLALSDPAVAG